MITNSGKLIDFLDVRPVKVSGGWMAIAMLRMEINPTVGLGKTPRKAMINWRYKKNKQGLAQHYWFLNAAPRKDKMFYTTLRKRSKYHAGR